MSGDGDVDYYQVFFNVTNDNTCQHTDTFQIPADGGIISHVLTELRPGLTYDVSVRAVVEAVNGIDESESQEALDTFTTGKPVINLYSIELSNVQ